MTSSELTSRPVGSLFQDGDRSLIPIYQRAYAWTEAEVETLLRDVRDARQRNGDRRAASDYYLGTLVVDRRSAAGPDVLEVVDGQQRLTTLFILLALAAHHESGQLAWAPSDESLTFQGRPTAASDLALLARFGAGALERLSTARIKGAAQTVLTALDAGRADSAAASDSDGIVFSIEDLEYLRNHVRVLRAELPPDTDLNHYFEVMNTRGEQLEKSEVLKAQLMSKLPDAAERDFFAEVWTACSVMERHVQLSFSTDRRSVLFGRDWDTLQPTDSKALRHLGGVLPDKTSHQGTSTETSAGPAVKATGHGGGILLSRILADQKSASEKAEEPEDPGRYGPIVDFGNFLLHVLRIFEQQNHSWSGSPESPSPHPVIRLDDKDLLKEFAAVQARWDNSPDGAREKVWDFCFRLLRIRWLFDTYVIRTQITQSGDDEENWVLHRAKRREYTVKSSSKKRQNLGEQNTFDDQDQQAALINLQSMFQVSDTRRASKYFLLQILFWLDQHHHPTGRGITADGLLEHIEDSAWMRLQTLLTDANILDRGTSTPNFAFNILDYVLWVLSGAASRPWSAPVSAGHRKVVEALARLGNSALSFRFRFRTSVEHFYPQSPDSAHGHQPLSRGPLDSFGNLCLMFRTQNSQRSNLMPAAKIAEYTSTDQSIKFQLMADRASRTDAGGSPWMEQDIEEHGSAMRDLLRAVAQLSVPEGAGPVASSPTR